MTIYYIGLEEVLDSHY